MIRRPFFLPGEDRGIRGDLRLPEGPPARSAVVVVHGFKGFKDWGFFPHLCETLVGEGHAVVSFNFSLSGIAEDFQSFGRLDDFARNTLTREVEEILIVLEEVRGGLLPRPVRKIGLLGHSRGGGEAVIAAKEAAAAGEGIQTLVTWAGLADFDRWSEETKEEWRRVGRTHVLNSRTGQHLPLDVGLLEDFERNRERLDVTRAARELDVPWLIVHGEYDNTVGVEDAHRLVAANDRARLELVPKAGHTFEARHPFVGTTPALDQAMRATVGHFRKHLTGAGSSP